MVTLADSSLLLGYLQSVIGPVNLVLRHIYHEKYTNNGASQNISSIAFAGTGQFSLRIPHPPRNVMTVTASMDHMLIFEQFSASSSSDIHPTRGRGSGLCLFLLLSSSYLLLLVLGPTVPQYPACLLLWLHTDFFLELGSGWCLARLRARMRY